MLKQVLTLSVLLALVSLPLGSASLHAQSKTLADYDLKTLAIVVNRDSSDITFIDTKTDTIINRIPLGQYTNAHMAMLNHEGKKIAHFGHGAGSLPRRGPRDGQGRAYRHHWEGAGTL